jgi:hypothetical protein
MDNFFYLAIVLIMSPTEVQVIFNKVSVEQYKEYNIGTVQKKTFQNSADGFQLLSSEIDAFSQGHHQTTLFMNASTKEKGGGWMLTTLEKWSAVPDKTEIDAFAKKNNQAVSDNLYAAFAQEKEIKNVTRNK